MSVRPAAVAGTWYPSAPQRLKDAVAGYLARAARQQPGPSRGDRLVALVAPHAGLVYSGPVAAFAYAQLIGRPVETIVLVGPSHYVAFEGASLWARGAFDMPLGAVPIDEAVAADLLSCCPVVHENPAAHLREHALEMQLPFIASVAPGTPIVPIVMGQQTRETADVLGEGLAAALQGRRAVLVASSDLSHYYTAPVAADLDARVMARVEALDPEGLMALLEARPDHACGGGPIVSVLHAARRLGATSARVLEYADSGDVSGDKSSVVGYMAAAAWR